MVAPIVSRALMAANATFALNAALLLPCPLHVLLPRYPRLLGAGLHLSHLSHFRGPAQTVRNILDCPKFNPPAEIITLERNYRAVRFERRLQGLNRIQFRSRADQHRPPTSLYRAVLAGVWEVAGSIIRRVVAVTVIARAVVAIPGVPVVSRARGGTSEASSAIVGSHLA